MLPVVALARIPVVSRANDHVVDMWLRKGVRAAVVLEGGDEPALGFSLARTS